MNQPSQEPITIQAKWDSTENIPTLYANQIAIMHTGNEFYLIFGEVQIPIILNQDSDELPETLQISPVAKIAVSPSQMRQFADVINQNVQNYLSRFMPEETENDNE